jgi:predicted nucleotidyltransferase
MRIAHDMVCVMQQSPPTLLPIFRSALQGDLLAYLLGQPERSFTVAELARTTGADASTVSREATRLVGAGLVADVRVGRTRVLRADQTSPFFPELSALVGKAFGPAQAAAAAFGAVRGVHRVVVFGSWAARAAGEPGPPPRDLDVLVVGSPSRVAVHRVADELGDRLGLPVQVTFATGQEWRDGGTGVIAEIRRRPYKEFPDPHDTGRVESVPSESVRSEGVSTS